jgi:hypothetical protein
MYTLLYIEYLIFFLFLLKKKPRKQLTTMCVFVLEYGTSLVLFPASLFDFIFQG